MTTSDFDTCFREQFPKLVALGVAMSGSREIARELAQETMLRAHRRWDEVGSYDAPAAWLRRVMSNLLIDHHRTRAAERSAVDRLGHADDTVVRDPEPSTDWAVLIEPLPPSQRAIVTLYYGEDRSVAEIAEILEIAEGTVKSGLAKARSRLADELQRTNDDTKGARS